MRTITHTTHDDLGQPVALPGQVRRIVSLVPSLTEAIAATDIDALVGATDWCTHPAGLDVPRIRGTKNPDVKAITALKPDLVLANKEENRRLDVERLRASGVPVWVTEIETLDQALDSMDRIFTDALGWGMPDWLAAAREAWAAVPPQRTVSVAIPIWRDPWMVVGSRTFTGDLAHRLGWRNVFGEDAERYPHATIDDIVSKQPDVIVLPDEPYVFTVTDGPDAFPDVRCVNVSGRLLTWYGPSLIEARQQLGGLLG